MFDVEIKNKNTRRQTFPGTRQTFGESDPAADHTLKGKTLQNDKDNNDVVCKYLCVSSTAQTTTFPLHTGGGTVKAFFQPHF